MPAHPPPSAASDPATPPSGTGARAGDAAGGVSIGRESEVAPSGAAGNRKVVAAVVVVAAVAALAAWSFRRPAPEPPAVVSIERDGLRFAYHVHTGRAYLWDLGVPEADRVNLLPTRPADATRLRRELEKQLGVEDLDTLHEPFRERAEQLRSLGYL